VNTTTDNLREGVKRTAAKLVEASGGTMTQEQAVRRVAAACERADRQAENNHR
jgi:hypothetical protein